MFALDSGVTASAHVGENCPFFSLRSPHRALPTETTVESGTSQSKSGTSVNSSNSGESRCTGAGVTSGRRSRNVQRFRGGLVFKAHRLCVSLNSRLESNTEEKKGAGVTSWSDVSGTRQACFL